MSRPSLNRLSLSRAASTLCAEEGYTLLELSVALLVAGLVATVALTTYTVMATGAVRWQRALHVENTLHLTLRRVSTDLWYADQCVRTSEGSWLFIDSDGRRIQYQHGDGRLLRNGHRLVPDPITVDGFTLTPEVSGSCASLVHISIALSNEGEAVRGRTAVAPRRHANWMSSSARLASP